MNDFDEQDELGRNVTHLFKSDKEITTATISVSLDIAALAFLEGIARETDKTVAQVIRDAIGAYQSERQKAQVQR